MDYNDDVDERRQIVYYPIMSYHVSSSVFLFCENMAIFLPNIRIHTHTCKNVTKQKKNGYNVYCYVSLIMKNSRSMCMSLSVSIAVCVCIDVCTYERM